MRVETLTPGSGSIEAKLGEATDLDAFVIGTDANLINFTTTWPFFRGIPSVQFDVLIWLRNVDETEVR